MAFRALRTSALLLLAMLLAGTLLTLSGAVIGFVVSPVLAYVGGAVVVLLPSAAEFEAMTRKRRRGLIVLTYVEQAVRTNVPLVEFLAAAEASERGKVAIRLRDVREFLEAGVAISVALDHAVPELTDRQVGLVAAAERTGRLKGTLARLLGEFRPEDTVGERWPGFAVSYVLMMLVIMTFIVGMIMIFVIPKFKDIFRDFGLPLPDVTERLIDVSAGAGPTMVLVVVLLAIVWMGRAIWKLARRRAPGRGETAGVVREVLASLPFFGRTERARAVGDVCRVAGDAIESGWPADQALLEASSLPVYGALRERVRRWSADVHNGTTLAEGARRSGMPELVVGMLATNGGSGSEGVSGTFDFLARYYSNRFSRAALLLQGALVPAVVVCLGCAVGTIVLGLFMPMIALIDRVQKVTGLLQ